MLPLRHWSSYSIESVIFIDDIIIVRLWLWHIKLNIIQTHPSRKCLFVRIDKSRISNCKNNHLIKTLLLHLRKIKTFFWSTRLLWRMKIVTINDAKELPCSRTLFVWWTSRGETWGVDKEDHYRADFNLMDREAFLWGPLFLFDWTFWGVRFQ